MICLCDHVNQNTTIILLNLYNKQIFCAVKTSYPQDIKDILKIKTHPY